MRWTRLTQKDKEYAFGRRVKKLQEWQQVFLWKPIEIEPGKWIWMEKVWRRAKLARLDIGVRVKTFKFGMERHLFGLGKVNTNRLYHRFHWEYKTDVLEMLKD